MNKIIFTMLACMTALTANAQFIFRVSGNGLEKPSYILGSVHIASPDKLSSSANYAEAEQNTEQLYVEMDISNPQRMQQVVEAGFDIAKLPDNKTFLDYMNDEQKTKLKETLKEKLFLDLDLPQSEQLLHMQPQLILMTIMNIETMKVMQKNPEFMAQGVLDAYCINRAKERNWEIGELDEILTKEEAAAKSPTIEAQVDSLMNFINNYDKQIKTIEDSYELIPKTCKYWEDNDFESFAKEPQINALLAPQLFDDRNEKWFPKIVNAIKQKPTLFVFGCGHLIGDKGILAMLKEAGYTTEQLK